MEKSTVEKRLKTAIRLLYEKDIHLFGVDANERSITFHLGLYLQKLFPGRDVDCEYNRNGHNPKRIHLCEANYYGPGQTVYPDIIIHERGSNKKNLLVIEAAKELNSNSQHDQKKLQHDKEKLLLYRRELKYAYAVFIELPDDGPCKMKWVTDTLPKMCVGQTDLDAFFC